MGGHQRSARNVQLSADGVYDVDGSVVKVQFWRDADGNGAFGAALDQLLGSDTYAADGWSWIASSAGWGSGLQTFFARDQDNGGSWSNVVSADLPFGAPTIGWLAASADGSVSPPHVNLDAQWVSDTDGTVTSVQFWHDIDGDSVIDVVGDVLLGTDTNGADGWSWNGPTQGWSSGQHVFLARAQDNDGNFGPVQSAYLQVGGVIISSLYAQGNADLSAVTLTASGVVSWGGQVASASFWRDLNGDSTLDPLTDELLGADADGADGWSLTASAAAWPVQQHTLFARARDSLGNQSDPAATYWSNAPEMANPNWKIYLTNYGYSDLLLDSTPGFVGREYLSGEWGAAVAYNRSVSGPVSPTWIEPNFSYPDWTTNSNFTATSP